MTNARKLSLAETRKQRLLREALVDVQALARVDRAVDHVHRAQPDHVAGRPSTPTGESIMQAIRDNVEVTRYQAIGIGIPAAILLGIAVGLMTINVPAPVSTARAHHVATSIHAVPDASTVFDAGAVAEPLPPTF